MSIKRQGADMRLLAFEEHRTFSIWRHAVNLALIARGDEKIASRIKGQCPNVFGFGIVIIFALAILRNSVDLAVWRGRDEHLIFFIDGNRVDLESLEFSERLFFARRRYPV